MYKEQLYNMEIMSVIRPQRDNEITRYNSPLSSLLSPLSALLSPLPLPLLTL